MALLPDLAGAATLRVNATGGADGPGCGSESTPCATIQQAVDLASAGDTILVAQGTYVDSETCANGGPPGKPTVVCVQKDVTILGGFDPPIDNWSTPDPDVNTTIIDGEGVRRGVIVNRPEGGLRMEGFTIREGLAQNGGNEFGGGMWAVLAGQGLTLRDMVFVDNVAEAGAGKQAGGGGLAVQGDAANILDATLERVRFEGNEARGGGVDLAGSGLGGGLHADHATVTGFDLELVENHAIGGASADGLGGGASFLFGTSATLENILATGNIAVGGLDRSAFGGAIYAEGDPAVAAEVTEISLVDATLSNNEARAGSGSIPGGASGGGLLAFKASATIDRASVLGNAAVGGKDEMGDVVASAGGGGVFFWAPDPGQDPTFTVRNSIIAKNVSEGNGGGGSGLRLLGATATVGHVTVAENEHVGAGLGSGLLSGGAPGKPSHLDLEFSIVAGHATGSAIYLQQTGTEFSTGTFTRSQFTGNVSDRCNPAGPLCTDDTGGWNNWGAAGGNLYDGAAPPTYFVDAANSDFHIDGTSPPSNAATGSTEAIDLDGAARDANRDIGADEFGATAHRLTIRKPGLGAGTVTSNVAGINCGTDCTELYGSTQVVNLDAVPDPGFLFDGFGGDADCLDASVLLSEDRQCDAPFAEIQPGAIVVEKQTLPDGRTETFLFTGEVGGDISDGQQLSRLGLAPGTYLVTETDHPLFDLTDITCDDGPSATPSAGNLGSLTATFEVDQGETVKCTFTNTLTTCSAAEIDVVLLSETVTDIRQVEACNSITGGPYTVGATGRVTLETLEVGLRNDFTVVDLGELTVVLNVP